MKRFSRSNHLKLFPVFVLLLSVCLLYGQSPAHAAKTVDSAKNPLTELNALLSQKSIVPENPEKSSITMFDEIVHRNEILAFIDKKRFEKDSPEVAARNRATEFLEKVKKNNGVSLADIKVEKVDESVITGKTNYNAIPYYKDAAGNYYMSEQMSLLCLLFPAHMDEEVKPILEPAKNVIKMIVEKSK